MHEDLIAQRAVDRHLTEDLIRFKTTVAVLTAELTDVKQLEKRNRREAVRAQEDVFSFHINQWRRQDFFGGGGKPWALKGYHAPPAGGPGAKAPRTVTKFHFLKRCKVLENESSFQKYQHFLAQKIYFS